MSHWESLSIWKGTQNVYPDESHETCQKTVTIHPKISVCISHEMKPIFATSLMFCVVIIIVMTLNRVMLYTVRHNSNDKKIQLLIHHCNIYSTAFIKKKYLNKIFFSFCKICLIVSMQTKLKIKKCLVFNRFWGEIWLLFYFREVHPLSADLKQIVVFMIGV